MAERLLNGDTRGALAKRLKRERTIGRAWDVIARDLYTDAGIEVSTTTLRKWATALGIS